MLLLLSNKGGVGPFAPATDLLGWNAILRWGMQGGIGPQPGADAVALADADKFIFVNNAAFTLGPWNARFGFTSLPAGRASWTLQIRATLSHAFDPTPTIPYAGTHVCEFILADSAGNRYRRDLPIIGFPGESTGIVWQNLALKLSPIGGLGTPNQLDLNFTNPSDFEPGFLIDRLQVLGL